METETRAAVHAHRCETCFKQGKNVFWIHSDECKDVLQAHKCPECGTVEWKKALIEPPRMPKKPNAQPVQNGNAEAILGYLVLFVAIAALGYAAFLAIKRYYPPTKEIK